jgi:hypothetical protein
VLCCVAVSQVLGLWYILLITLGMSLILTAIQNLRKPHRRQLLLDFLLFRWIGGRGQERPSKPPAAAAVAGGGGVGHGAVVAADGAVCEGGGGGGGGGGRGRGWRIGGRKWRMRGLRLLCLAWQGHRIMVKSVLKQCELAAAAGSAEGVEKETALPGVAGS